MNEYLGAYWCTTISVPQRTEYEAPSTGWTDLAGGKRTCSVGLQPLIVRQQPGACAYAHARGNAGAGTSQVARKTEFPEQLNREPYSYSGTT